MISAAGVTVLEKFFGKHYAFLASEDVPQIPGVQTRAFGDLQALLEDMKLARIYGGMHFPTAVEEGAKQGKKIGKWVLATVLQPVD